MGQRLHVIRPSRPVHTPAGPNLGPASFVADAPDLFISPVSWRNIAIALKIRRLRGFECNRLISPATRPAQSFIISALSRTREETLREHNIAFRSISWRRSFFSTPRLE